MEHGRRALFGFASLPILKYNLAYSAAPARGPTMWVIHLIYGIPALLESVVRFDVWMKKPLEKAIPNLDHLLSDPAGTLSGGEIEIPPDRRLGSALLIALVASPAMC